MFVILVLHWFRMSALEWMSGDEWKNVLHLLKIKFICSFVQANYRCFQTFKLNAWISYKVQMIDTHSARSSRMLPISLTCSLSSLARARRRSSGMLFRTSLCTRAESWVSRTCEDAVIMAVLSWWAKNQVRWLIQKSLIAFDSSMALKRTRMSRLI